MNRQKIINVLPRSIRHVLEKGNLDYKIFQEIKMRIDQPIILTYEGKERMLLNDWGRPHIITKEEMYEFLDYITNYSLYAYEEEMRQGFVTIAGGHRVGIAGQIVAENGKVKQIKYISSVNVRISHEILGCADSVFFYVIQNNQFVNTMIISPPGCGKTTLLRDMIRQLSDGNAYVKGMNVGVVDERSEIGGCYQGVPQNHLGKRTDILDCCPKVEGMMMLVRSMSPQIIAMDEIGTEEDIRAIEYAVHCGCRMLVTVHGDSMVDIQSKRAFEKLLQDKVFQRFVLLNNQKKIGNIVGVFDSSGVQMG